MTPEIKMLLARARGALEHPKMVTPDELAKLIADLTAKIDQR